MYIEIVGPWCECVKRPADATVPNLVVKRFDPHFPSWPRLNELIALPAGDVLFVRSVPPCPCLVCCTQPFFTQSSLNTAPI